MRQVRRAVVLGAAGPSLFRWGTSPDADLVYRALATLGPRTGRGLKLDLGMTVGRVDRAIDELESAGAVVSRPGPPDVAALWVARPVAEVVAALDRARSARHALLAAVTAAPRATVATVLATPVTLGEGLRQFPTRALTRVRLAELAQFTRHEHLAMNPEPIFEPAAVRAAAPLDRKLVGRGIRMRLLGVQSLDADPLASFGRPPEARLPGYRQALDVPMKLIVIDRKVALFPVDPGNFDRGYLEVTQAPVVSALVALFERQWERAWDPREDAMPSIDLTPRERELILLLAQGHTDTTAARELGISARSVTSILRTLMDRVQVDNRFQLGLALGALRAVPPPHPATPSGDKEHDDQAQALPTLAGDRGWTPHPGDRDPGVRG